LYTGILASATYAFFGSSMQLTVGSTALISLMTGEILTKYGVDYEEDLPAALDTAAQAAFTSGLIITVLGILNLGDSIRFVSQPVMSGFTTGAAFTIGLSQLRSGFGFALNPPQQGGEVEYNYEIIEWWLDHWYDLDKDGHRLQNVYATTVRTPFPPPSSPLLSLYYHLS
jgi:MFS superfamily sulfate permease-like transporter